MLVFDLLNSCAHEDVAGAAVASIGGTFASDLQAQADERGLSLGSFAAARVQSFARVATERDWRELVETVRGKDFPVLSGLQLILTKDDRRFVPAQEAAPRGLSLTHVVSAARGDLRV